MNTTTYATHRAEVAPQAGSVNLPAWPRAVCRAELGFLDDGVYITVLKSNEIRMPTNAVSERGDEEWMVLRRDLMRMIHMQDEQDMMGTLGPLGSAGQVRAREAGMAEQLAHLARQVPAPGASTTARALTMAQ